MIKTSKDNGQKSPISAKSVAISIMTTMVLLVGGFLIYATLVEPERPETPSSPTTPEPYYKLTRYYGDYNSYAYGDYADYKAIVNEFILDNEVAIIAHNEAELTDAVFGDSTYTKAPTNQKFVADFSTHDYAVFAFSYDQCSEKNIKIESLELSPTTISTEIGYDAKCYDYCPVYYRVFALPVEKGYFEDKIVTLNMDYVLRSSEEECPYRYTEDKPIIYLYPEEETELEVKLGYPEKLSASYPKYDGSWKVLAQPDGSLTDLKTGRELYALYWEGIDYKTEVQSEGFVVKGEDSAEFLEQKLAELGLNEREAEEFIVYWLPKLEANKYNYIHFELTDELNASMPLEISEHPDTLIRIAMSFKGLSEPIEVREQTFETPVRSGFTVVEWGGHEIK